MEMKLCKDCKYYKKDWGARILGLGDNYDKCMRPVETNLVTGKSYKPQYCDQQRRFSIGMSWLCGPEGQHWEAK
jgi:hypothetical protein